MVFISCPPNMILSVILAVAVVWEGVLGTVLVPIEEIVGYTTPSTSDNQKAEEESTPSSNLQLLVPLVMAAKGEEPKEGLRMGNEEPSSEEGQEVFLSALSKLIKVLHQERKPTVPPLPTFAPFFVPKRHRPRRPLRPLDVSSEQHDPESCPACMVLKALQSVNVKTLLNRADQESSEEDEEPNRNKIIHVHGIDAEGETCIMCLLNEESGRRQVNQDPGDVGPIDEPKPKHQGPIP